MTPMHPSSPNERPPGASRRSFVRQGLIGSCLVGLGSALGWWPGQARAQSAGPVRPGRTLGKEFTYDVSPLLKTDPRLVRYQPVATLPTGLKEARRVAVGPKDRIYVAGDQCVRVFDPAGQLRTEIACPENPRCLTVESEDRLWVGFPKRLALYDGQGRSVARWKDWGSRAVLTSVAVWEDEVFVADAGNRIVHHGDRTGKLKGQIGKKDPARKIPGFVVPSPYFDLATAPDGILWAANPGRHQIEAYTPEGSLEYSWGEFSSGIEGFCGCCNPINFALLPDGRFVTCEKGLPRVKVYSPRGKFECVVAGPDQFARHLDQPGANAIGLDVATDTQGRVLVLDPLTREVRVFTRSPSA